MNEHVGDTLDEMVGFKLRHGGVARSCGVIRRGLDGSYDFVKPALEAVGAEIVFHKVTQKPVEAIVICHIAEWYPLFWVARKSGIDSCELSVLCALRVVSYATETT